METALLSTVGLDDELREIVQKACQAGGLDLRCGDLRGAEDWLADVDPTLILGVLPAGQRSLPYELRRAASELFPKTPLLLLCEEPLVQGTVSLEDGRLFLLGAPHSLEQIQSRIRVAARASARASTVLDGSEASSTPSRAGSRYQIHELRGAACWAATIEATDLASGSLDQHKLRITSHAEGVESSIPVLGRDRGRGAVRPGSALALAGHHDDGQQALQYDLKGSLWRLQCVAPQAGVWLFSERRLPPLWDLAAWLREQELTHYEFSAASGDLLLFLQDEGARPAGRPEISRAVVEAARLGGPAVLEQLAREFESKANASQALLMEVR